MPTDSAQQALSILRDGSQFQWHVIPLLAAGALRLRERDRAPELERGLRRPGALGHGLVQRDLERARLPLHPVRAASGAHPADTAFLILIGLNIEICFMFAIMGIVVAKTLPADPRRADPRRAESLVRRGRRFGLLRGVELVLNAVGALTWDYWWWNARMPWLIVVFGYLTFFVVALLGARHADAAREGAHGRGASTRSTPRACCSSGRGSAGSEGQRLRTASGHWQPLYFSSKPLRLLQRVAPERVAELARAHHLEDRRLAFASAPRRRARSAGPTSESLSTVMPSAPIARAMPAKLGFSRFTPRKRLA